MPSLSPEKQQEIIRQRAQDILLAKTLLALPNAQVSRLPGGTAAKVDYRQELKRPGVIPEMAHLSDFVKRVMGISGHTNIIDETESGRGYGFCFSSKEAADRFCEDLETVGILSKTGEQKKSYDRTDGTWSVSLDPRENYDGPTVFSCMADFRPNINRFLDTTAKDALEHRFSCTLHDQRNFDDLTEDYGFGFQFDSYSKAREFSEQLASLGIKSMNGQNKEPFYDYEKKSFLISIEPEHLPLLQELTALQEELPVKPHITNLSPQVQEEIVTNRAKDILLSEELLASSDNLQVSRKPGGGTVGIVDYRQALKTPGVVPEMEHLSNFVKRVMGIAGHTEILDQTNDWLGYGFCFSSKEAADRFCEDLKTVGILSNSGEQKQSYDRKDGTWSVSLDPTLASGGDLGIFVKMANFRPDINRFLAPDAKIALEHKFSCTLHDQRNFENPKKDYGFSFEFASHAKAEEFSQKLVSLGIKNMNGRNKKPFYDYEKKSFLISVEPECLPLLHKLVLTRQFLNRIRTDANSEHKSQHDDNRRRP